MGGNTLGVLRHFENAKIGDVCACITTSSHRIPKRMARGDSEHRIGLVRYHLCRFDSTESISMGGILLLQDSEMRKSGGYLCPQLHNH